MTGIVSPDGGAKGVWKHTALKGGTVIEHSILLDKYGSADGRFLSTAGTPFDKRDFLMNRGGCHKYSVVKTLHVQKSDVLPCFEQPGGGSTSRRRSLKSCLTRDILRRLRINGIC